MIWLYAAAVLGGVTVTAWAAGRAVLRREKRVIWPPGTGVAAGLGCGLARRASHDAKRQVFRQRACS